MRRNRFLWIFALFACLGTWATSCADDSGESDVNDTGEKNGATDTTEGDQQGDTSVNGDEGSDDTTPGGDTTAGDDTGEQKDTGSTEPQNTLAVTYNGNYLMDNAKTADADYIEQHKTSIQVSPAFFGRIDDVEIPYDGAPGVHYEVYGLKKTDGTISVLQMSFDESSHAVVNPFIQLTLAVSKIEDDGSYALDPTDPKSRLMVFNVKENLAFDCVRFVAAGAIEMSDVVGMELSEGGAITLHASDLDVQSAGDISGILKAEGKRICGQGDTPDTDDKDTGSGADTGSKDTGTGSADTEPTDTGSATQDTDTGSVQDDPCYGVPDVGCCRGKTVYWCFTHNFTEERTLMNRTCDGSCDWDDKIGFRCDYVNPDPVPEDVSIECPAALPGDI